MKVRIYQINMDRDACRLAFFGAAILLRHGVELSALPADRYDITAEGEIPEAETLEDVYNALNPVDDQPLPSWYKTRSLSVSDVVEVLDGPVSPGLYFCNSIGFKPCSWWACPPVVRFADADGHGVPCELLPELPEPGELWHGHRIVGVVPAPITEPQPEAEIWQYSVWRLNLAPSKSGPVYAFVAVRETEAETI